MRNRRLRINNGDKIRVTRGKKLKGKIGIVVKITAFKYAFKEWLTQQTPHYADKDSPPPSPVHTRSPWRSAISDDSEHDYNDAFASEDDVSLSSSIDKPQYRLTQQIHVLTNLLEEKLSLADCSIQERYISQLRRRFLDALDDI